MAERMVLPARSMGRIGEVRTCAMVASMGVSVGVGECGCTAEVRSQYTGGAGQGAVKCGRLGLAEMGVCYVGRREQTVVYQDGGTFGGGGVACGGWA
jgi:hypothetical protein